MYGNLKIYTLWDDHTCGSTVLYHMFICSQHECFSVNIQTKTILSDEVRGLLAAAINSHLSVIITAHLCVSLSGAFPSQESSVCLFGKTEEFSGSWRKQPEGTTTNFMTWFEEMLLCPIKKLKCIQEH